MAKLPSGILGRVSGKVGDVVGAAWKGIPYIRQYVIPGNPNTAAQQLQRSLFADIVALARTALGGVIQPFWDPFLRQQSGWARFIGVNRKLYLTQDDYSSVQLAQGTLEGALITTAFYSGSEANITWSTTVLSNGSPSDKAVAFVYDAVNKVGFIDASSDRNVGGAVVEVGSGRVAANLKAWLFFVDSTTNPTLVSYSDYEQVT